MAQSDDHIDDATNGDDSGTLPSPKSRIGKASAACLPCRGKKIKCVKVANQSACLKCQHTATECVPAPISTHSRRRRNPPSQQRTPVTATDEQPCVSATSSVLSQPPLRLRRPPPPPLPDPDPSLSVPSWVPELEQHGAELFPVLPALADTPQAPTPDPAIPIWLGDLTPPSSITHPPTAALPPSRAESTLPFEGCPPALPHSSPAVQFNRQVPVWPICRPDSLDDVLLALALPPMDPQRGGLANTVREYVAAVLAYTATTDADIDCMAPLVLEVCRQIQIVIDASTILANTADRVVFQALVAFLVFLPNYYEQGGVEGSLFHEQRKGSLALLLQQVRHYLRTHIYDMSMADLASQQAVCWYIATFGKMVAYAGYDAEQLSHLADCLKQCTLVDEHVPWLRRWAQSAHSFVQQTCRIGPDLEDPSRFLWDVDYLEELRQRLRSLDPHASWQAGIEALGGAENAISQTVHPLERLEAHHQMCTVTASLCAINALGNGATDWVAHLRTVLWNFSNLLDTSVAAVMPPTCYEGLLWIIDLIHEYEVAYRMLIDPDPAEQEPNMENVIVRCFCSRQGVLQTRPLVASDTSSAAHLPPGQRRPRPPQLFMQSAPPTLDRRRWESPPARPRHNISKLVRSSTRGGSERVAKLPQHRRGPAPAQLWYNR